MSIDSVSEEYATYWNKVYREGLVNTVKDVKEGARQLVTITSALQGLYFVAISMSDIRFVIQDARILVFTLPIIPWLVCLGLAIWPSPPPVWSPFSSTAPKIPRT